MAEARVPRRKPRIRKAPTVRERAEEARAKAEVEKPRRARRIGGKLAAPVRQVRAPKNKATQPLYVAGRFVKKVLKRLIPRYFVNAWRELRQTTWPSRRETWRLTVAVFIFAAVFGALVAGVDKGLDELFKKVILK